MSRAHPRHPMNTQIYEEASDWLVKHRTGELGEAEKVAFDSWLRTSPNHVRAYLEMSEIWEDAAALDPATSASVDELIARAQGEGNVVSLGGGFGEAAFGQHGGASGSGVGRSAGAERGGAGVDRGLAADSDVGADRGAHGRFSSRALLAAAIAVMCAGVGVFAWLNRAPVYSTGIGEQRSLTLDDGSMVTLDTRSRIRVRFSARERNIDLLEGQALFRVAKNDRQPFVVKSDAAAVRAVGTEFDVYRQHAGLTVTVLQGRVAVTASSSGQRRADDAVLVPAGQQVAVLGSAKVTPSAVADVAAATAWTQRRLIFESTPLAAVVEEFNRYNTRRLVIADPGLSSFHVSGVFSSTDPALLVQFLRMQAGIAVRESDHEIDIDER
jgi:transmembrane sensor